MTLATKKLIIGLCLFCILSPLSAQPTKSNTPDVSISIYESHINKLLAAIGPISGKGKASMIGDYTWEARNPRIELQQGSAQFVADTTVRSGFINYSPQTKGQVAISYDADKNKIKVKVVKASFELYFELFGSRTHLTDIDISSFYQQEFEFDGPSVESEVQVAVSDTQKKKLRLKLDTPTLQVEPKRIVLNAGILVSESGSK